MGQGDPYGQYQDGLTQRHALTQQARDGFQCYLADAALQVFGRIADTATAFLAAAFAANAFSEYA
jgi:hypothetical protein